MSEFRAVARRLARDWVRRLAHVMFGSFGFLYRLATPRPQPFDPTTIQSILVIRIDLLGDVLLSMTAVEGLRVRYPHAHLTMLTLPYTAPLARLYTAVDEVVA